MEISAAQVVGALITVAVSGVISTVGASIATKVHLAWMKEAIDRHEKAIGRAHQRIDEEQKSRRGA